MQRCVLRCSAAVRPRFVVSTAPPRANLPIEAVPGFVKVVCCGECPTRGVDIVIYRRAKRYRVVPKKHAPGKLLSCFYCRYFEARAANLPAAPLVVRVGGMANVSGTSVGRHAMSDERWLFRLNAAVIPVSFSQSALSLSPPTSAAENQHELSNSAVKLKPE